MEQRGLSKLRPYNKYRVSFHPICKISQISVGSFNV